MVLRNILSSFLQSAISAVIFMQKRLLAKQKNEVTDELV